LNKSQKRKPASSRNPACQVVISAGLLKIFGVGTLIIGDSGIGKSESSLELIARGHKFISDDVVEIFEDGHGRLQGRSPRLTRNFMESEGWASSISRKYSVPQPCSTRLRLTW